MDGDFHDVNKTQLGRLDRLLRGESDDRGSGQVAGASTQDEGVDAMAKKAATGATEERALPGMEEESVPPAVLKAVKAHHANIGAEADAKAETKLSFDKLHDIMVEHDLKEVKFRVDGNWKKFSQKSKEIGKFTDGKDGKGNDGE